MFEARILIMGLVALAGSVTVAPAQAAVVQCAPPVLGELVEAPTELAARQAAIASWTKKIAHLGERYASWRLARGKRYQCARMASGAYSCAAFAAPCTILQKPPAPGRPSTKPGEAA
jgi:hypothetical protein